MVMIALSNSLCPMGFRPLGGQRMVALSYQRVHAFELTQKLDRIVLEGIAKILHMNVTDKKTYSTVVTCNKTTIIHIIDYYPLVSNQSGRDRDTMKGIKSLEYRIWSRSFSKKKQDYATLFKTRELMRSIRSIRLDPCFCLYPIG
jgi:hypothetical protein